MGHEHHNLGAGQGFPVLDIGGEMGALVLRTPASEKGREIEISPISEPNRRTHVEVLERRVGSMTVYAAVYGPLAQGGYRIWDDGADRPHEAEVVGGQVTEVFWD